MWTSLAASALKTVTDHLLDSNKGNNSKNDGNYSIEGHFNDKPVNVTIRPGSRAFGNASSCNQSNSRSSHNATSSSQNRCSNCSKPTEKSSNQNIKKKQNKNDNTFCIINMPKDGGNIDIRIKKTEARFSNMNVKGTRDSESRNSKGANNGGQTRETKGPRNVKNVQLTGKNKIERSNNNQTNNVKLQNGQQKFGKVKSPMTWMYVGRLNTTEADLLTYLTERFHGYQFKIESLPKYKDGKLPRFKVQVDNRILDDFQRLSEWPDGVNITKFNHNFKRQT